MEWTGCFVSRASLAGWHRRAYRITASCRSR